MPRLPRAKTRKLTIYLLKAGLTDPAETLADFSSLDRHSIAGLGDLFVKPSITRQPTWVDFFSGSLTTSTLRVRSASASAVLLLQTGGRSFALTFGYGRNLILPGSYEEGFGLRVTLNSIGENTLRSIDRKRFDALALHSKTQSLREASTGDFGVDVEQDLLRAATGRPNDPALGSRMTGMDPLSVQIAVMLPDLPALLVRYYEQFQSNRYQQHFQWVDHIREVTDARLADILDAALLDAIKSGTSRPLWMAVPDIIDWHQTKGFTFRSGNRATLHEDITLNDFLTDIGAERTGALSIEELKKGFRVSRISEESETVVESWSPYRCLYAEVDHGAHTYLITDGRWYRVDQDFVQLVNDSVQRLLDNGTSLPTYSHGSEAAYNQALADSIPGSAVLDADNAFIGGGSSQVEVCDVITPGKQFIHVKRYGQAKYLSHLFSQGRVSAELFAQEERFRRHINDKVPAPLRVADPSVRPPTGDYQILYVVIGRLAGPVELPFFSRVNLRSAARFLTGLGYRVAFVPVSMSTRGTARAAGEVGAPA